MVDSLDDRLRQIINEASPEAKARLLAMLADSVAEVAAAPLTDAAVVHEAQATISDAASAEALKKAAIERIAEVGRARREEAEARGEVPKTSRQAKDREYLEHSRRWAERQFTRLWQIRCVFNDDSEFFFEHIAKFDAQIEEDFGLRVARAVKHWAAVETPFMKMPDASNFVWSKPELKADYESAHRLYRDANNLRWDALDALEAPPDEGRYPSNDTAISALNGLIDALETFEATQVTILMETMKAD